MANIIQVKRTSTSGRQPNTTGSYATNSQYIAAGEFALNMADGVLYTSNGTAVITVGANIVNLSVTNNANVANVLSVGNATGSYAFNPISVMTNYGNQNNYVQHVLQNASSGLNASGDIVLTNDTGNDTIGFIDLGINSSTYSNAAYNITGAGDGYLYTSNGHLAIGTASGKELIFHANGTTSSARVLTVNATSITIANTIALVANGSNGTAGQVLSSNGTATYWSSPGAASVNVAAQYTWTNTQTFSNTITFGTNILVGTSVNAASYTVGAIFVANTITLNANGLIANSTGAYVSGLVNATSLTAGATGTGTGGLIANTTTIFTGNNTVNAFLNTTGLNINAVTIANTTGVYTGVVNSATFSVGTTFIANTTQITIASTPLSANGSNGTAGQILTSNGNSGSPYWAAAGASTLDYGGSYALKAFYG